MKRIALILVCLAALYLASYAWFRFAHVQRWDHDGYDYVIFPQHAAALYYVYRPLSYLDAKFTGMRFHIGRHRP